MKKTGLKAAIVLVVAVVLVGLAVAGPGGGGRRGRGAGPALEGPTPGVPRDQAPRGRRGPGMQRGYRSDEPSRAQEVCPHCGRRLQEGPGWGRGPGFGPGRGRAGNYGRAPGSRFGGPGGFGPGSWQGPQRRGWQGYGPGRGRWRQFGRGPEFRFGGGRGFGPGAGWGRGQRLGPRRDRDIDADRSPGYEQAGPGQGRWPGRGPGFGWGRGQGPGGGPGLGGPARPFGPYGRPDANAPTEITPKPQLPPKQIPSAEESEQTKEDPSEQDSL